MDILPTCLELGETSYPEEFESRKINPIDGQSIVGLITGKIDSNSQERILFWEHEGNRSVRKGDWKLVALNKKRWELYDLSSDPFELNNQIAQHPEIASELSVRYKMWAAEHGVQPWPLRKNKK